jgi:N6-adenosine-specific RNA methylase IME4
VTPSNEIFRTVVADPPWSYSDRLQMSSTPRGADANYLTMTVPEICALYDQSTQQLAGHPLKDDAFLFLWVTNPFILNSVGMTVCKAWHFEPKQIITWVKGRLVVDGVPSADRLAEIFHEPSSLGGQAVGKIVQLLKTMLVPRLIPRTGLGHYTRGVTEHMILATRGRPKIFIKDQGVSNLLLEEDTVLLASPTGHSRKPEASYQLIERVCPGPYLELFARQKREGWTSWGNEL